tara:strand:- start:1410 stop:1724 length:315 start_codon:yes stop_codon:yes gene_type:complete
MKINPDAHTEKTRPKKLLKVSHVASMCSLAVDTVYRKAKNGEMPAPLRLGRCCRWRPEHIEKWIDAGCPANQGELNLDQEAQEDQEDWQAAIEEAQEGFSSFDF